MKTFLRSVRVRGQGLTEYAVVLSLIAVSAIAVTALFGGSVKSKIAAISGAISGGDYAQAENNAKTQAKDAANLANEVNGMEISADEVKENSGNNGTGGKNSGGNNDVNNPKIN